MGEINGSGTLLLSDGEDPFEEQHGDDTAEDGEGEDLKLPLYEGDDIRSNSDCFCVISDMFGMFE